MLRLPTPLDLQPRLPGKYLSNPAGILIPADQTFFTARIACPNWLIDPAWPDRGPGGKSDPHAFDNEKTQILVGGLDTEVLRVYFFLSLDDGLTWIPSGHVGTTGGQVVNLQGDPLLDMTYTGKLRGIGLPNRRIQVVLDVRESLVTKVEIDVDSRPLPPIIQRDLHSSISVTDTASGQTAGATSISTSTNLDPTGTDRYLVAWAMNAGGTLGAYTSITFGAVTQTQITDEVSPSNAAQRLCSAGDVNPSTTGATVTYTCTVSNIMAVGAVAFDGVDQTTPRDTPPTISSGTGTAFSHTVTDGGAGDVRIAGMASGGGTIVFDVTETSRVEEENITGHNLCFGICTKEDGGSDAMNGTLGGSAEWCMRGFNINVAAGGAVTRQQDGWLRAIRRRRAG